MGERAILAVSTVKSSTEKISYWVNGLLGRTMKISMDEYDHDPQEYTIIGIHSVAIIGKLNGLVEALVLVEVEG